MDFLSDLFCSLPVLQLRNWSTYSKFLDENDYGTGTALYMFLHHPKISQSNNNKNILGLNIVCNVIDI
jgi:hypothetical protein